MAEMIDFIVAVLSAVADFIATPPIFYLFGVLLFLIVCKALKSLMSW